MSEQIHSFPPILSQHPKILILGTMPSVSSLQAMEYYAFPGNVFWKIISAIHGIDCPTEYEKKKQMILEMDLALWDVCHSCIRSGSADSEIKEEEPNQIRELLASHPSIHTILFNGKTAEKLFHKHLKSINDIRTMVMPSTSPAYTLSFEKKRMAWSSILV